MNKIQNLKLFDLCDLSFGQYVKSVQDKGVSYLQVKNFSDNGSYLNNVDNYIAETDLKKSMLLEQDDVLFVSKGMRFFAYKYDKNIGDAVASSIFYIIKASKEKILSDYLVCILNHPKSIAYFNGVSAGSSIPSIRKKELLDFVVAVPTINEQAKIVEIFLNHQHQIKLFEQLKEKKQNLFNELINQLIK